MTFKIYTEKKKGTMRGHGTKEAISSRGSWKFVQPTFYPIDLDNDGADTEELVLNKIKNILFIGKNFGLESRKKLYFLLVQWLQKKQDTCNANITIKVVIPDQSVTVQKCMVCCSFSTDAFLTHRIWWIDLRTLIDSQCLRAKNETWPLVISRVAKLSISDLKKVYEFAKLQPPLDGQLDVPGSELVRGDD